jgi:hypothetical protein
MSRLIVAVLACAAVVSSGGCPTKMDAVFADQHDGDEKRIVIDGSAMTITPFANNETWVVDAVVDETLCSASIDFNVEGKPNPPPCNLNATLFWAMSASTTKYTWEFTDPSGTLSADPNFPLNTWVQIA